MVILEYNISPMCLCVHLGRHYNIVEFPPTKTHPLSDGLACLGHSFRRSVTKSSEQFLARDGKGIILLLLYESGILGFCHLASSNQCIPHGASMFVASAG